MSIQQKTLTTFNTAVNSQSNMADRRQTTQGRLVWSIVLGPRYGEGVGINEIVFAVRALFRLKRVAILTSNNQI